MDGSDFVTKIYKSPPIVLYITGSTAHKFVHKEKKHNHGLLCKVGQSLLCALQCHWLCKDTLIDS